MVDKRQTKEPKTRKKRTPKQDAPLTVAPQQDATPLRTRGKREAWIGLFLKALEADGIVAHACKEANIERSTAYRLRRADKEFAKEWDEAEYSGSEALIAEMYRRGVEGVEKPVYQGGARVGTVTEYSDTLLLALAKAKRPEQFRERNDNRNINLGPEELDKLSDDELRQIIGLK